MSNNHGNRPQGLTSKAVIQVTSMFVHPWRAFITSVQRLKFSERRQQYYCSHINSLHCCTRSSEVGGRLRFQSPLLSFLSCLPGARLLEEGNIEAAEEQKQRIEQLQRERRRVLQDNNMTHQPRFFKYALVLHAPVSVPPSACSAYDRASPFTSATVTHVV